VIYSRRMVKDELHRDRRAAGGVKSLDNPNVPRPKDKPKEPAKDGGKDTFRPSSDASSGGSPAVAVASAVTTNYGASPEARVLKLPKAYSAEFLQLWAEYPQRSGSAAKEKASIQVAARLREGVPHSLLLEKTRAYRSWAEATGKVGTEKVMQAARFYGASKEYEQGNWSLPTSAADSRAEQFRKRGYV